MILTPDEIIVIVAEKVAYDLLGSCGNFPDEVEHLTRESTLFCSTVDDITMECTCCGWSRGTWAQVKRWSLRWPPCRPSATAARWG